MVAQMKELAFLICVAQQLFISNSKISIFSIFPIVHLNLQGDTHTQKVLFMFYDKIITLTLTNSCKIYKIFIKYCKVGKKS